MMNLTKFKSDYIEHKVFKMLTIEAGISIKHANDIIEYIHRGNYLQIIYSYGLDYIKLLIAHHEDLGEYEICGEIKLVVDNYNKSTGANLKIK